MAEEVATSAVTAKKIYTLAECREHSSDKDCWLVIHGKVYNVTDFLDEHPGGFDIVVSASGKDATDDFEEIGHSNSAKEMLEKYIIGEFAGGDKTAAKVAKAAAPAPASSSSQSSLPSSLLKALLPVLILLLAVAAALFMSKA